MSNRSENQQTPVNILVETHTTKTNEIVLKHDWHVLNHLTICANAHVYVCCTSSILSPSRRLKSEMQPAGCKDLIESERPDENILVIVNKKNYYKIDFNIIFQKTLEYFDNSAKFSIFIRFKKNKTILIRQKKN